MKYIELKIKDEIFSIRAEEIKGQIWFHFKGKTFVLDKQDVSSREESQSPSAFNEGRILSHIPGQVLKVLVCGGQAVKKNQVLLILSSMKMEHTIRSPVQGVVQSVPVKEGDQVSEQTLLVQLA